MWAKRFSAAHADDCRIQSINACPDDKGLLFWRNQGGKLSITLKEIFDAFPSHDLVWVCCRDVA